MGRRPFPAQRRRHAHGKIRNAPAGDELGAFFLINTARGKVVQQPALVRALTQRWIAGAALDVFDPEPPPPDSPLYALDNLIVTPHVAGLSIEVRRELAISAATQVLQVLRGERPPNVVNPDVWDKVQQRLPVIKDDGETPSRANPGS